MNIAIRIAVSLIAPFVALYLMISFVMWGPVFAPGSWGEGSRVMYLYVYISMAALLYAGLPALRGE